VTCPNRKGCSKPRARARRRPWGRTAEMNHAAVGPGAEAPADGREAGQPEAGSCAEGRMTPPPCTPPHEVNTWSPKKLWVTRFRATQVHCPSFIPSQVKGGILAAHFHFRGALDSFSLGDPGIGRPRGPPEDWRRRPRVRTHPLGPSSSPAPVLRPTTPHAPAPARALQTRNAGARTGAETRRRTTFDRACV
jgi:hypothetical protein